MSIKTLLGMETWGLKEVEIMARLKDAIRQQKEEIEFISEKGNIKIQLTKIDPIGMMRRDWDYYHNNTKRY